MDKWKTYVLVTIKRKLDKRAGVTDGGKKGGANKADGMIEEAHDPEFTPF